ncbi:MAG: transporter [Acidobacteriaceae bacterium]
MTRVHSLRILSASFLLVALACLPAHATNKDMIQLQTQVQQLQDAVANLQKTNDESIGMLRELVQQTADSVNKMSVTVNGLKLSLQNQQDAIGTSNQQLSGQVQSLNDSVDELKARMDRMEKSLGVIQSQQQTANAALSNLPQAVPAGNVPATTTPAPSPNGSGPAPIGDNSGAAPNTPPPSTQPNASNTTPNNAPEPIPAPAAQATASAGDMYRGAYADYISARYALASSEFTDLIKAYPDDNLAGNAYFYLGEMQLRLHKPSLAIKNYDQVITRYVDNAKIPAAELHKAYALADERENDAAERELRELIQRFPVSPEASQARTKLNSLRAHE